MANLKKKLLLVTGLWILIAFCLTVAASAQGEARSVSAPASYDCTVTVSEGASVNGAASLEVPAFTEVVLSAPSSRGGESFLYWKDTTTGAIVSVARRTYARVYDDTTYEAVYGDGETDGALDNASTGAFLVVTAETKYLYVSRYVPSDATVVAYGTIYSLDESVDLTGKTLDDVDGETVKVKRHSTSAARISTIGYTVDADTVSYLPFVIVADAEGTETVTYGNAVKFVACDDAAHGAALDNVRKDTSTCSAIGTVYYGCAACGYRYDMPATAVNPDAHLWQKVDATEPTCTEVGNNEHNKCAYCDKADRENEEIIIPTVPHDYKTVEAKEANCVEAGYEAHKQCKICDRTVTVDTEAEFDPTIEKKAHTMAPVEARPATCDKVGYNDHEACSVCGYAEGREDIPTLPHELGEAYDVAASYREAAYSVKDCKNCSYCEKTYKTGSKNEKLLTVVDFAESIVGKKAVFNVTAPLTGIYEVALKLAGDYVHTGGYSSLYTADGIGSVARIADKSTLVDSYSAYTFYVYLEKGENKLTFNTVNATAELQGVRLEYVADGTMLQHFNAVTEVDAETPADSLGLNKTYTFGTNGVITTSDDANSRSFRAGTREYRAGDTLSFELTVLASGTYRMYLPSGTAAENKFSFTIKDKAGNTVCSFTKDGGFSAYNADAANAAGSSATKLYVAKEAYALTAGKTYVVTVEFMSQDIFGSLYFAIEQHEHDYSVDVAGKENTCKADGYEAYKLCSVCDKPNGAITVIPASDEKHDFSKAVERKEGNCQRDGWEAYTACSLCDAPETEIVVIPKDPDNHAWTGYMQKAPTCTEVGYEQYRYCYRAGCTHSEGSGEIAVLGHDMHEVEEKPATCVEDGYSAHTACLRCDYTEGKTDYPKGADGHDLQPVEAKAATCSEDGYNAHKVCSICGFSGDKFIIPAEGHRYGKQVKVEASYKRGAYLVQTCEKCGGTKETDIVSEPKLTYTVNVTTQSDDGATITVTAPGAGLYELSFKLASVPASSGYTTVYAKNGYGSKLRIGGADVDENGYSAYKFYVYLDAGENTVTVKKQGAFEIASANISYVAGDNHSPAQSFIEITKIAKDQPTSVGNVTIVPASAVTEGRIADNGVLLLRKGDTLSFTFTVATESTYELALLLQNQASITIADGSGSAVYTISADDITLYNASAKIAGSESVGLYVANGQYTLSAGTYTVTLTAEHGTYTTVGTVYFKLADHVHDFSIDVEGKAATCSEEGYTAHKRCAYCDAVSEKDIVPKNDDHDMQPVDAKAPTCSADGFEAYTACSLCGVPETEIVVIPKNPDNHVMQAVAEKPATCEEDGYSAHMACACCDHTEGKSVYYKDASAHAYENIPALPATCVSAGYSAYQQCTLCGEISGKVEYLLNPDAHAYRDIARVEPTCTTDGAEAYKICTLCGHEEGAPTIIPAPGHDMQSVEAKLATCGEAGYSAHEACSRCDHTEGKVDEAALDHVKGEPYHVEASYTQGGYNAVYCTACGTLLEKTYVDGEEKLNYVFDVNKSDKSFSFDVTVNDAGVYELALKLTTVPTASGYTSVYAASGYGSVVRIGGSEADADGYSLYRFYVYLDAGKNTVSVQGQAAMAVSSVKLSYVTGVVGSMTETFDTVTELAASFEYSVKNGNLVTSSDTGSRRVRNGVLQLRSGDKVTYTLTVNAAISYTVAMIGNNDSYTMTIEDASGNKLTLGKNSFVSANESRKTAGSESALLWVSSAGYALTEGVYTVTITSTGNLILGGVYFAVGEHDHEYTVDVPGKAADCKEAGWEAYKRCAYCDEATARIPLPVTEHDFSASYDAVLPTRTEAGHTAYTGCSVCGHPEGEITEYAPLYNKTDVIEASGITVDGGVTITVTAEKAGFYYMEVIAETAKSYYTAKNTAYEFTSRNRLEATGSSTTTYHPQGFTVYLDAGENTVTLTEGTPTSVTAVRFTRLSETLVTGDSVSARQANNSSFEYTHDDLLVVDSDGLYTLGAFINASGTASYLSLKIEILDESGEEVVKTVNVDIADIQSRQVAFAGSTNTSVYVALEAFALDTGSYQVRVSAASTAQGGSYVNYTGYAVTEMAMN